MSAFPKMLLTNAGIILQAKVQSGVTLELTRIGLGDGNLNGQPISPLKNLINQTASVPINDKEIIKSNTLQVSGFFSNQDIQKGFYWREFGVFANDPDNGEVLYAYSNAGNAGDYIPTIADQRIEKYIYASFAVENAENVNITIPQSDTFIPKKEKGAENGVASLDETGKIPQEQLPELDFIPNSEKGQPDGIAPLNPDGVLEIKYGGTGAKDSQNALYNLGAKPNDNLLDNAYFAGNGTDGNFPIIAEDNRPVRWIIEEGASITLTDKGLKLTSSSQAGMLQKLSQKTLQNTSMTLSIFITEISGTLRLFMRNRGYIDISDVGIYKITYTGSDLVESDSVYFRIMSGAATILVIKLEYGDKQTLGYKYKEQWNLFEIPNYTIEKTKCQRYYYRSVYGDDGFGTSLRVSPGSHYIPFKATMRSIPNIKLYGEEIDFFTANLVSSNGFILTNTDTVYTRACDFEAVAEL